jgi:SAM-dependent methyltransferase
MESEDFEINPELAKEYLSVTQRLNKMFGTTKRQGEEHFRKFSNLYGNDYAECYRELGRRSYEANNARVSAHLLRSMITERNQDIENLEILDLASGPEMLSRHSQKDIQKKIHSVDILEQHFEDSDSQNFSVGSYLDIPKDNKSIDYCNFGLAFHHMKLHFKDETYEPVKAFMEMNRILKTGGRVMISFIHSMELRDFDLFEELIQDLGFKIVKNYSGQASHQGIYETEFITLEKVVDTPIDVTDEDLEETVEILGKERVKGFHWNNVKNGRKTSTRKDIIDAFTFNGKNIQIDLNEEDQKVLAEEKAIVNLSKELKKKYERIENIPDEEILENNFIRYRVKSGLYRLFKKLEGKNGAIITK